MNMAQVAVTPKNVQDYQDRHRKNPCLDCSTIRIQAHLATWIQENAERFPYKVTFRPNENS